MIGRSPWAAAVNELFHGQDLPSIFQQELAGYQVSVHHLNNALWIAIACPKGIQVILRPAYAPADHLQIERISRNEDGITVSLSAAIGNFKVQLRFPDQEQPLMRYTSTFTAKTPLLVPFWPRDMVIAGPDGTNEEASGTVYISQTGTRSGLQYIGFDQPKAGALLYFQNLTALNDYAQATETSLGDTVGGTWPELGFALPPTLKNKPIPAGQEMILSDAFLLFSPEHPTNEVAQAKQFLNLLAAVYLHLPKPNTQYHDWLHVVGEGLHDLEFSHACWSHGAGQDYLNAYVADYATPPEIMVQLAVLMPLTDYYDWCKTDLPAIKKIQNGLDAFYNENLGTVVRFLPALAETLDGSEEQLQPDVMDSWYLHHPLLNLGRLALRGDAQGKRLFLNSIGFAIKVARHFNYEWPVLYHMATLEVVKAETTPGMGGEKDVAGLYALVMLHAWELTKEKKYLNETKKAAESLKGKGFQLFYQANNTAFSANALLWLYKETKDEAYMDLAYVCLANVFKNLQLWECDYGYAKNYATFFAVFPLNDAPYTAAYEEQEVFASFHNFMLYAEGEKLMPSVNLLLPEFLRYIVNRAAYYYPPNLPPEMLCEKTTKGQLDRKLWIAIEDIHDGWEQSGGVGQEVYGAGVAFGIVPRHFYRVPGEHFLVYNDYPTTDFRKRKNTISFEVKGDARLSCRMLIIKTKGNTLPHFSVSVTEPLNAHERREGNLEYIVNGGSKIKIKWT
jgi:hypothetical protein